jgi:hypothetical protein
MLRRGATLGRGQGMPMYYPRCDCLHHVCCGLVLPVRWKSLVLGRPCVVPGDSGELATIGGGGVAALCGLGWRFRVGRWILVQRTRLESVRPLSFDLIVAVHLDRTTSSTALIWGIFSRGILTRWLRFSSSMENLDLIGAIPSSSKGQIHPIPLRGYIFLKRPYTLLESTRHPDWLFPESRDLLH